MNELDLPARRANVAALHAKAATDDERWICDEFVRLFDAIDFLTGQRRALQQDRIALAKLTADICAYFRLKSEMDRMVQYGRDPGEEAYDRLDAMRAQLPS